jgi:hypothetical protein
VTWKSLPIIDGVSDDAFFLAVPLIFGGLGFVFGRHSLILLVVVSPIVFWTIWGAAYDRGEGDDVTGAVAGGMALISLASVVGGVALRWLVYGVAWLRRREPAETRPRHF